MALKLLNGLKVLELGDSVAVAFCGKLLAGLGADVLVIELPGGSPLRRLPPYYQDIPGTDRSVLHNWLCAEKRSITLDLEQARGNLILLELLRGRDALVRGPAKALDVADIKAANPKLSVITISPFGTDGPYANYRANDLIHFAMSGFSYYLSSPVGDPATTPPKQNPGYQVGLVAGLRAASATLWAIVAAGKKGEGVMVDLSELEAFTYLMYQYTAHIANGTLPADRERVPGAAITIVGGLVWCLPCSDGWVMVSPREDHQFRHWAEVIGDTEWASQPEFSTLKLREQNAWVIYERSAAWTKLRKKNFVFLAAQEKKVACFPVSSMSDLPDLEQLKHRGFFAEIDHPVIKGLRYPGLPAKIDNRDTPPTRRAPLLGEHTLETCAELGISSEDIKTLWQQGVI